MYLGKLREYQKQGLKYLISKKSVLVGWDLGLGKTHLSMAYCEGIKHQNHQQVLILCPSAIIYQWKEEIEKFTDSKCIVINGPKPKRVKQWRYDAYYYITNYEKLRYDPEIFMKKWGVVVVDECTKLKNPKAKLTLKAKELRAVKKIALSGTPIHNTPNDLYSIVNFLYPNLMGTWWQFANRYIVFEPRELGNGKIFNEITGFKNLDELHRKISMFFIRKKKEDVLTELPPVIYETLTCEMNKNQQNVYNIILSEILAKHDHENVLHLFTGLKLLSNHPTLLKETKGEKLIPFSSLVNDLSSNKLNMLIDFIEDNKSKQIVIFSQYTKILDIIAKNINVPFVQFRGNQTKEQNNTALHNFKENKEIICFLSSDAGAYGVNLQNASILVNYDLPYNPSVYNQRIGREHRIGQKETVVCINLVTQSSIETKVLKILSEKQNMIDKIIDGKTGEMSFINQIWRELKNG